VDWVSLIKNDDNFKNILQVRIQKEFKVTPHYLEMEEHHPEYGYHMGVYLCLGQPIHMVTDISKALLLSSFSGFQEIHEYMSVHKKIFLFLGDGKHKIKKKAEQIACDEAIRLLDRLS
jgi:dsRNA-specific ribonuclease